MENGCEELIANEKCDIWAAGIVFYQLLTSEDPWNYNPSVWEEFNTKKNEQIPNELIPKHISGVSRCILNMCLHTYVK